MRGDALKWLGIAGLLWCLLLWSRFGNAPLCHGLGDYASYEPTRFAWNHVRYGLAVTKGRQIRNLETTTPDEFVSYLSHPGVTVLAGALCFWVAGAVEPWAGRVFPGLATVVTFWFLFRLARASADRATAWFAVALFGLYPITAVHGLNLTYQPFMLLSFAMTLGCWHAGQRGRALAAMGLWGLVDFAALYPAPFLAWRRLRDPGVSRRAAWRFAAGAAAVCVGALAVHLTFVLSVVGDLQGGSARPFHEYVLQALRGGDGGFTWAEFAASQWQHLIASFTLPGIVLAALAATLAWRLLSFAERVLLAIGVLEVLIFRTHAHLHEFWWQDLTPFMCLAGGRTLAWLWQQPDRAQPLLRGVALGALASVAGLGGRYAWQFWSERDNPEVRLIAEHLTLAADPREVVFLGFPPEGWAVQNFRHHPVGTSSFLLPTDFREVLCRLGGDFMALNRPVALWLPQEHVDSALQAYVLARFPDSGPQVIPCASPRGARTYLRFDIGAFLRDPERSPFLQAAPNVAALPELVRLSRRFQILALLAPGESVAVWDGLDYPPETHLQRELYSHGAQAFVPPARRRGAPCYAVAWPGTPQADQIRGLYPGRAIQARQLVQPERSIELQWIRVVP